MQSERLARAVGAEHADKGAAGDVQFEFVHEHAARDADIKCAGLQTWFVHEQSHFSLLHKIAGKKNPGGRSSGARELSLGKKNPGG